MRFCFSYKCKEELEALQELKDELRFEQELHTKLRKEHDILKKENQRLNDALHDSTEAYNNAVKGIKKKPGRKPVVKAEQSAPSISPFEALFGAINAIKKPKR